MYQIEPRSNFSPTESLTSKDVIRAYLLGERLCLVG